MAEAALSLAPENGKAVTTDHSVVSRTVGIPANATSIYAPFVKGIDTGLMATALLLIAGTYYLTVKHSAFLASVSIFPTGPLQKNIQLLLETFWPLYITRLPEPIRRLHSKWAFEFIRSRPHIGRPLGLLHKGSTTFGDSRHDVSQCVKHCTFESQTTPSDSVLWLENNSSAFKNLIQIALWEYMSIWLVVIMVISTTVYNGFTYGEFNPDRYPRIALILIYTTTFLAHLFYTFSCLRHAYSSIVLNGCWTLLFKASFGVVPIKYSRRDAGEALEEDGSFKAYKTSVLGPTEVAFTMAISTRSLLLSSAPPDHTGPALTQKRIRELQEAEIKILEKATEVALERVIFNASILLGISVVTGFSTWTQSQLLDATSTQLGSLALLASTSSGMTALLTSISPLSSIASSAWRFLGLTEAAISGKGRPDTSKSGIGFTNEGAALDYKRVTLLDFWRASAMSQVFGFLVFGPAYILLPIGAKGHQSLLEQPFRMSVKLKTTRVVFEARGSGYGENVNVMLEPETDTERGTKRNIYREIAAMEHNEEVPEIRDVAAMQGEEVEKEPGS